MRKLARVGRMIAMWMVCCWAMTTIAQPTTFSDKNQVQWTVNEMGELQSYDGYEMRRWGVADGLPAREIRKAYPDGRGRVWIFTDDDPLLTYIDAHHRVRQLGNQTGMKGFHITHVVWKNDTLWLRHNSNIFLIVDEASHKVSRFFGKLPFGVEASTDFVETKRPSWQRYSPQEYNNAIFWRPTQQWLLFTSAPVIELVATPSRQSRSISIAYSHLPEMRTSGWEVRPVVQVADSLLLVGLPFGVAIFTSRDLRSKAIRLRPADYNITLDTRQKIAPDANYLRIGSVNSATATASGVWIATEDGLFLLQKNTLRRISLPNVQDYTPVQTVTSRQDNEIWAVAAGKVYYVVDTVPQQLPPFMAAFVEEKKYIHSLHYHTPSGTFWGIESKGQVFFIQNERDVRVFEEGKYNPVQSLVISDTIVWGISQHGLIHIAREKTDWEYHRLDAPTLDLPRSLHHQAGELHWFADNGWWKLPVADSQKVGWAKKPPTILLRRVKIDGEEQSLDLPVFTLKHTQKSINFQYVGVAYTGGGRDMFYKYAVIKIREKYTPWSVQSDTIWQTTDQRELNLLLDDGLYIISIVAVNKYGMRSAPMVVQVRKKIAPWKRPEIIAMVVLVLALSVIGAFIQQRNTLERRNRLLTAENEVLEANQQLSNSRTELLIMELRMLQAQMNTHFIANALTAIQGFVMKSDKLAALNYIVDFHAVTRLFLDASRTNEHSLGDEIDLLSRYLRLQKLFFEFTFEIEIGEDIFPNEFEVPTSFYQPFVENAVVHGLKYKQGKDRHLAIRFYRTRYTLTCEVADNGIGRKASREINAANRQFRRFSTGVSTKIIKNRLHILKNSGRYPNVEITYRDLDPDSPTPGTHVTIVLHLPKEELGDNDILSDTLDKSYYD